jgi:hypothetical protein
MTCMHFGNVHICRPSGYYIGQLRRVGCRNWRTVTGHHRTSTAALRRALIHAGREDKRARTLFIDRSGWYEPSLGAEARLW